MKKRIAVIMLVLLAAARTALAYDVMVVTNGGETPLEQVIQSFGDTLVRLLPARGVKSIKPVSFHEIDIRTNPDLSRVEYDIRAAKPDLILAVGRSALRAVHGIGEIPVLYLLVVAPESVVNGAGNVTGIKMEIPARLQFDEIAGLLPRMRRVGVIYNTARSAEEIRQARSHRPELEFVALHAESTKEVPGLLEQLRDRVDLIWLLPDLTATSPQILESYFLFSFRNKVPVLAFSEKYLKSGAAVVVTFDLDAMGGQAADMAARILTGTPVRALPPVHISRVKTIVNPTVARKLQLDISAGKTP